MSFDFPMNNLKAEPTRYNFLLCASLIIMIVASLTRLKNWMSCKLIFIIFDTIVRTLTYNLNSSIGCNRHFLFFFFFSIIYLIFFFLNCQNEWTGKFYYHESSLHWLKILNNDEQTFFRPNMKVMVWMLTTIKTMAQKIRPRVKIERADVPHRVWIWTNSWEKIFM